MEPVNDDKNYKKDKNAAMQVMKAIQKHNENPENKLKYKEFPKNTTPDQVNRACKTILHNLMTDIIGENYFKNTWQRAYNGPLRGKCKAVIEQASQMKEFEILSQTFNNWAIEWQAAQKMKSGKPVGKSEPVVQKHDRNDFKADKNKIPSSMEKQARFGKKSYSKNDDLHDPTTPSELHPVRNSILLKLRVTPSTESHNNKKANNSKKAILKRKKNTGNILKETRKKNIYGDTKIQPDVRRTSRACKKPKKA